MCTCILYVELRKWSVPYFNSGKFMGLFTTMLESTLFGKLRSCQMCSTYLQNENIDCCIKDKINGLASH